MMPLGINQGSIGEKAGKAGSRLLRFGSLVVIVLVGLWMCFSILETLDAHQIMCIQNPITGKLTWHISAGIKWQGFGKVTKYDKRSICEFSHQVRFNDAGHATMTGSVQFDMPLDKEHLDRIQSKFGSEEAVKTQLLQTVVNKCLYMTGPMMSSKESYAEKRSYLINFVEDQISNGIFQTIARDTTIKDPISGVEKMVATVEIVKKDGIPARQEEAVLKEFGVRAFNFSIEKLDYDETVEKQIQQQQQMTMAVQTAIAEAKKAEQAAITAEANGKANAATAKWEQEANKARAVTIAEKDRDSCKLVMEAAEYRKKALILEGEGEATKRKLILQADGALSIKLDKWLEAQQVWAEAFAKYQGQVVPTTVMGGSFNGQNGATQFMEIMAAKAARDLSLDMSVPKK
jgi:regulator of protease activity HflC (stomatin/prohibitin superfamily)